MVHFWRNSAGNPPKGIKNLISLNFSPQKFCFFADLCLLGRYLSHGICVHSCSFFMQQSAFKLGVCTVHSKDFHSAAIQTVVNYYHFFIQTCIVRILHSTVQFIFFYTFPHTVQQIPDSTLSFHSLWLHSLQILNQCHKVETTHNFKMLEIYGNSCFYLVLLLCHLGGKYLFT